MGWKHRIQGGALGVIGFLLSPLSWWNDLFINVPLAVGFGWLVSLVQRSWFEPAVIMGYWLTNIIGLVLLQKGIQRAASAELPFKYSWKNFAKDLVISLLYTLLILVLVKLKVVQPISDYFAPSP